MISDEQEDEYSQEPEDFDLGPAEGLPSTSGFEEAAPNYEAEDWYAKREAAAGEALDILKGNIADIQRAGEEGKMGIRRRGSQGVAMATGSAPVGTGAAFGAARQAAGDVAASEAEYGLGLADKLASARGDYAAEQLASVDYMEEAKKKGEMDRQEQMKEAENRVNQIIDEMQNNEWIITDDDQKKYAKRIRALARQFSDPEVQNFINERANYVLDPDNYGLF